jgi:hypothetical protein
LSARAAATTGSGGARRAERVAPQVAAATVIYGEHNGRAHRERTARGSVVIGVRFGQAAPGFSLPSTSGGEVALADFKGKSDVVLVFYCYDWGSI